MSDTPCAPAATLDSAVHLLAAAVAATPDAEALVCGPLRLDYRQYARCVAGFAAELREAGCAGGRIAVLLPNSAEGCIALLAGQAAGAQIAPVNVLLTACELEAIFADLDARAVIYDAALADTVLPLAERYGIGHRVPVHIGDGQLLRWRDVPLALTGDLLPDPAALSLLLYTGGTTGQPKGVNVTNRASAQAAAQLNSVVPGRIGQERMLCAAPLSHIYAIAVGLYNMLYSRGTLVVMPRYVPDVMLDLMEHEAITMIAGSPTMFVGLLNHESMAGRRFPTLRCSLSGASALPEETLRRWETATGAPVLEGFGQTETAGGVTFNPLSGARKPGSVGLPMRDVRVEIVDVNDGITVLPVGATGEIRLRGPQIMQGYRNRPAETEAALRNGWLYTSDVGYLDADGYLFISDRKKDMVVVSGFNVYPREVEEVLYRHPDIIEAAVVGVPDPYQGEALKAVIAARPGVALDAAEIERHCRRELAPYKVPRRISFVASLPKTAVCKIDKARLRD